MGWILCLTDLQYFCALTVKSGDSFEVEAPDTVDDSGVGCTTGDGAKQIKNIILRKQENKGRELSSLTNTLEPLRTMLLWPQELNVNINTS